MNPEGSLAGAHVTMADSVARLVTRVGTDPETGAPHGRDRARAPDRPPRSRQVEGRDAADLLLLDDGSPLAGTLADCLGHRTRRPVRASSWAGFRREAALLPQA